MVEEGGFATGEGSCRHLLGLLRVLLQVGQLEAAAEQQVQELGLREGGGGRPTGGWKDWRDRSGYDNSA